MPTMKWKCPQCGTSFAEKGKSFPFCCERCQMLDLGAWANEKYRIAARETDEDGAAELAEQGKHSPDEFEH